mmetsp:Transcript_52932/g.146607  ORF Transcript_52932/g.146607 Transcript_52932/m.146607 type:complete len:227 (-) Transcript_52932:9-689(-)
MAAESGCRHRLASRELRRPTKAVLQASLQFPTRSTTAARAWAAPFAACAPAAAAESAGGPGCGHPALRRPGWASCHADCAACTGTVAGDAAAAEPDDEACFEEWRQGAFEASASIASGRSMFGSAYSDHGLDLGGRQQGELERPGAKSRDVELPVFSTPSGFISFWYRNPADLHSHVAAIEDLSSASAEASSLYRGCGGTVGRGARSAARVPFGRTETYPRRFLHE